MKNPPKKLTFCPNCETSLEHLESFCPNCGQKNQDILLPLKAHLKDLFESIFNWDSRLIRSIKALFFNPGKMTVEFNEGKRRRYMPPLRLYLIASILFFLLFNLTSEREIEKVGSSIEESIADVSDTIDITLGTVSFESTGQEVLNMKHLNDNQLDSVLISKGIEPTFINRLSIRQSIKTLTGGMTELYRQFMQNASIGMFFLMPVFAGLLMIFYRKPKRFYVEHLILSVHLHSLVFSSFFNKSFNTTYPTSRYH